MFYVDLCRFPHELKRPSFMHTPVPFLFVYEVICSLFQLPVQVQYSQLHLMQCFNNNHFTESCRYLIKISAEKVEKGCRFSLGPEHEGKKSLLHPVTQNECVWIKKEMVKGCISWKTGFYLLW